MSDYGQIDLFMADICDVGIKGEMVTMENPVFALSTKPDLAPWVYEDAKLKIVVKPNTDGRPTIFDKDLLMYCISQVVEGINRGRNPTRRVRVTAHGFFRSCSRDTGGKSYSALLGTLSRLRGFSFQVHKKNSAGKLGRSAKVFGLIDSAEMKEGKEGRWGDVEVVLSEAVMEAIEARNVLTYNPGYYQLRSANDRRMYELCRKFCGNKAKWQIGFEKLYLRFGTRAKPKEFMRYLRKLMEKQKEQNGIPDYQISWDADSQMVTVFNHSRFDCG